MNSRRYAIRQLPGREKYIPWDVYRDRPYSHYATSLVEAGSQVRQLNALWAEGLTKN